MARGGPPSPLTGCPVDVADRPPSGVVRGGVDTIHKSRRSSYSNRQPRDAAARVASAPWRIGSRGRTTTGPAVAESAGGEEEPGAGFEPANRWDASPSPLVHSGIPALASSGPVGADLPRRASAAESSCSPISNTNVGSQRPPITKRQRRDRIDRLIARVERFNEGGGAMVALPDWWRTELVILGVRVPTPLTGAALHEALMDAQADALDTLPWPPPEDPADGWVDESEPIVERRSRVMAG